VSWVFTTTQLRQLWLAMATLLLGVCPAVASINSQSSTDHHGDPEIATQSSVQQLDRALNKSLEEFDQSMARSGSNNLDQSAQRSGFETDILSPRGNSEIQPSDPSVDMEILVGGVNIPVFGGSGEPAPPTVPPLDSADNKSSGAESTQSTSGDGASSDSSQQGQDSGSVPLPDDIGDGQGDNIVARQIREAAINESDPVLRERLWEEYRKVKNP